MGKRGPAPIPTAVKLMSGNPGKRPLNRNEPKPEQAAPTCPAWLSERGRAEWQRIVPELSALGLLTRVDRAALICYVEAVADLQDATELLAKEGKVAVAQSGYKMPHPACTLKRQAMQAIRNFAAEFGLSPASRSRISVPAPADGPDNELADFLAGGEALPADGATLPN